MDTHNTWWRVLTVFSQRTNWLLSLATPRAIRKLFLILPSALALGTLTSPHGIMRVLTFAGMNLSKLFCDFAGFPQLPMLH